MENPAESKLDPKQVRACLGIGPNLQEAFETLNKANGRSTQRNKNRIEAQKN
jgi:hypothetical protein